MAGFVFANCHGIAWATVEKPDRLELALDSIRRSTATVTA